MRAFYKIEIDLFLDESMESHVLERARTVYRAIGGAVQKREDRDVIVSAEGFIEGPDDALLELLEESIRTCLPESELHALRCKREPEPIVEPSFGLPPRRAI